MRLVRVLGALAILIAACGCMTAAEPEPPEPVTPIATVTADQLHQVYSANVLKAEAEFTGHWITITGEVMDIGSDILETPYLTFTANVQAMFPKEHLPELMEIRKGQSVQLTCRIAGSILGSVVVRECAFDSGRSE